MDFVLRFIAGFAEFGVLLALYGLAAEQVGVPHGWTLPRLAVLLGAAELVQILFSTTCSSLYELPSYVFDGSLDNVLLLPMSALAVLSFGRIRWDYLPQIIAPLGAIVWGIAEGGIVATGPQWIAFGVAIAAGWTIRWAVTATVMSVSLIAVRIEALAYFLQEVFGLARYPASIFPSAFRVVTLIVPVAFVANVPFNVLASAEWVTVALLAVAVAAVWIGIAIYAFGRCLKSYCGVG